MDRYRKNPFAYDNRRDRGPWRQEKKPARWPRVIVFILFAILLAGLWDGQARCVELNGNNSRYCVD